MSYIGAYFKALWEMVRFLAVIYFLFSIGHGPFANYLAYSALIAAMAGPISLAIREEENG